jgi:hypothetical protein
MEVRLKIASIMILAGLFFADSSASADTTAVYKGKSKTIPLTMTVEIADNGNVRYQMSVGRTYGLVLDDVDYFVTLEAKGPVVDRADDLVTAQGEAMAAFMPAFRNHDTSAGPHLVPIGKVTINGRTGQAFGYKPEDEGVSATPVVVFNPSPELAQPGKIATKDMTESEKERAMAGAVVVITDDPDLAQLGKAMSKQFGASRAMLTHMIGNTPGMFTEMDKLLQSGAPLSFAGMELESVNHAPIDPKRFELPAQPETLDQIRERMKPLPPAPTTTPSRP